MDIETIFIDTAFVYALFNKRDQWHESAVKWQTRLVTEETPLLTTEFVLTEIADGLASLRTRASALRIIRAFEESSLVELISADTGLFQEGLRLFETRPDKDWGLTDCTSFVVMKEKGLNKARTTDDHFRQAGFRALLLEK